ncbi:hypothetical protein HYS49_03880 [Candidatus Woesearchaeota archaeon]|nr:hypothetical protein [Candidatus Woesearchaeota archaeon]
MNNQTPRSFLPGLFLAVSLHAPALPGVAQTAENNDAFLESICGPQILLRDDYFSACEAQLQGEAAARQVEVTSLLLWLDEYLQNHSLYTAEGKDGAN